MKTIIIILFTCILVTSRLDAQSMRSYKQVIDDLAAPASDAEVILPQGFFSQPESSPIGKMQRGGVLLAAAGRAREISNPDRALILAAAAKTVLMAAVDGLSGNPDAKSQCQYCLGVIAEQYEGELAVAATHYQSAISLNARNAAANQALARVQFILDPPLAE